MSENRPETDNSAALRNRIVIVGNGPVALFTAYCLNHSSLNEVIILGREGSSSIEELIGSGRLMLNTKTIRDLYSMIHQNFQPTPTDPDISIEFPGDTQFGRAIQNGDVLASKFEKMLNFGALAAAEIKQRANGPLTNKDLNQFTQRHFEMPVRAFAPHSPVQQFNTEGAMGQGAATESANTIERPIYATTDASLIGSTADLVITALKAHSITGDLAARIQPLLKPNAPILVASNGVNTTLVPPGDENSRALRPLKSALSRIPALEESAKFSGSLEEAEHDVLGASITFALQLAKDMPITEVNHDPKPGDLVVNSNVHEAYFTLPKHPVLEEVFAGTPIKIETRRGVEYTKSVLNKLSKNLMNLMCAGFGKRKDQVTEDPRFRAAYADAVGELYDVARAYNVSLNDSRSGFGTEMMGFHDDSVSVGGHKSSTVVDIENRRPTEAQFLIEAVEQLADEKDDVDIHVLRILRRSIKSVESVALDRSQDDRDVIKRAKQLARNVVLLPNGHVTQIRNTADKAEITDEGINAIDDDGHRASGTYYPLIPASAYNSKDMNPKTSSYLLIKRLKDGLWDDGFMTELLNTFYDPESEDGFTKDFEPLEKILLEGSEGHKLKAPAGAAQFIDDFLQDKRNRKSPTKTFNDGSNGGGGTTSGGGNPDTNLTAEFVVPTTVGVLEAPDNLDGLDEVIDSIAGHGPISITGQGGSILFEDRSDIILGGAIISNDREGPDEDDGPNGMQGGPAS